MIYRGKLIGGKIVFERPPELPEGQEVEVRAVESAEQADLAWLRKFEGIVKDSPTDDSVNVDRILYGQSEE